IASLCVATLVIYFIPLRYVVLVWGESPSAPHLTVSLTHSTSHCLTHTQHVSLSHTHTHTARLTVSHTHTHSTSHCLPHTHTHIWGAKRNTPHFVYGMHSVLRHSFIMKACNILIPF